MMEKVTAGATASLGKIKMDGYDASSLTGMMEKVTAGATAALGNIEMEGFDSGDLSGMVEKITTGATSALGEIEMTGYDSNDLSAMVEKVTSGTTGALGKIQMDGFSLDNVSSLESTISSSTTTALGKIQMDGFDPNNIPSDLTNSINTGVASGKQKHPPILKLIAAVPSPTNDTTPDYTFSSNEVGQITFGGSCLSSTTSVSAGNNKITLNSLSEGVYSNCSISVTDSDGNTNTISLNTFIVDTTNPVIAEITAVKTSGNDTTPDFTFSSTEKGTASYGGSCSSDNTSVDSGNNVVTLNNLSDGTYSDCTVTVTDLAGNTGDLINLTAFTIDTTSENTNEEI